MNVLHRKAFTMVELIFAIVIIGILTAVAVPKFAATRDDAVITKARATVAAVRNAIATERQKRILKGDFVNLINSLSPNPANIFDTFNPDRDNLLAAVPGNRVLEYAMLTCATLGKNRECWQMAGADYAFVLPDGVPVVFTIFDAAGAATSRFNCVAPNSVNCRLLTQ